MRFGDYTTIALSSSEQQQQQTWNLTYSIIRKQSLTSIKPFFWIQMMEMLTLIVVFPKQNLACIKGQSRTLLKYISQSFSQKYELLLSSIHSQFSKLFLCFQCEQAIRCSPKDVAAYYHRALSKQALGTLKENIRFSLTHTSHLQ
jgi:hypothetical protein